ncbi:hypothetical protein JRI60_36575 [Archangium violaceum]|uniref:putative sensor domain DACNV-containing protein n=1 Tax=Archangium violaceum TaxID=83451 RepID=UPI00194EBB3E|nr:hypothetical protein [Archangium violaceum]QRN94603.1 hypothetical protein JRI60_36575 [Archangium violaceum]
MAVLLYPRDHLQEALKRRAPNWLGNLRLVQVVGELLDLLFFASLSTEEGSATRVQVVVSPRIPLQDVEDSSEYLGSDVPRQRAWSVLPLKPQRLDLEALVKLSVVTEPGRTAVVLEHEESSGWQAVGIARLNTSTNGGNVLFLSTTAPGALSLVYAGTEIMRYERGQLAEPAPDIFISDGVVRSTILQSLGDLLSGVKNRIFMPSHGERVFERLVRGMRATGRGGLILVQPTPSLDSQQDIPKLVLTEPDILAAKIRNLFEASERGFGVAFREDERNDEWDEAMSLREWAQSEVDSLSDDIARLTAMDGALLLGPNLRVFGAGYKVGSSDTLPLYEAFDATGQSVSPVEYPLGIHGTRHRAAASFVASTGGFAFVASEDGPIKCLIKEQSRILFWKVRFPEI